jgi:hypothetical protein
MKRKLLGAMLILGGMLTAAHADTWVFTDTLRPNGHERSMAAKRADFSKCGAERADVPSTMRLRPKCSSACLRAAGRSITSFLIPRRATERPASPSRTSHVPARSTGP